MYTYSICIDYYNLQSQQPAEGAAVTDLYTFFVPHRVPQPILVDCVRAVYILRGILQVNLRAEKNTVYLKKQDEHLC